MASTKRINGKMIVFACARTLCKQTHSFTAKHKIRANIKSRLDSQKSGVTNHVQILQDNTYRFHCPVHYNGKGKGVVMVRG